MENHKKARPSNDSDRDELIQIIKATQKIQASADKVQSQLQAMQIEEISDDTFISIVLNGLQAPVGVSISSEAMHSSSEQLSQSVESTLKKAYHASSRIMQETMAAMLEEAGVPPERNFYRKIVK
ncbi:YbaB/EbfC family nucleoid-associated protein [Leptolyngbya sp. AN03gr2]